MGQEISRYNIDDITIRDLILDDLAGYHDTLNRIDENLLDRQASVVTYDIYGADVPLDIPLIVRKWIAGLTVKRLIPALETYIAHNEIRSDVQRDGYITFYDQLQLLKSLAERLDRRLIAMQSEVTVALAEDYGSGPPAYDKPVLTTTASHVTYDPFEVGVGLFPRRGRSPRGY